MSKKSIILFIFFLLSGVFVKAQQKPQYSQYILNNFLLNPALSGMETYVDAKLGYRSQWTGFDGAPVTQYFTINTAIGQEFLEGDAASMPGEYNPLSRMYTRNYMAAAPHHGVGLMVINDVTGPISQTNINATYAYHLGLTPYFNLSVGVSAGAAHNKVDASQLKFDEAYDPILNANNLSQWNPDLGLGVWGYSSNWYVGVSALQLLKQQSYLKNITNTVKTVPHYFFTAGFKVFLTDEITLLPSTLVRVVNPEPVGFDINMKMSFSNRFWVGGAYRHNDAFGAMAGVNLNSLLAVSYSYDYTTSALNTVSYGSHEIVLSILLNNRTKQLSPAHGW